MPEFALKCNVLIYRLGRLILPAIIACLPVLSACQTARQNDDISNHQLYSSYPLPSGMPPLNVSDLGPSSDLYEAFFEFDQRLVDTCANEVKPEAEEIIVLQNGTDQIELDIVTISPILGVNTRTALTGIAGSIFRFSFEYKENLDPSIRPFSEGHDCIHVAQIVELVKRLRSKGIGDTVIVDKVTEVITNIQVGGTYPMEYFPYYNDCEKADREGKILLVNGALPFGDLCSTWKGLFIERRIVYDGQEFIIDPEKAYGMWEGLINIGAAQ